MTQDDARTLRAQIEAAAAHVPEEEALQMPAVFPAWVRYLRAEKEIPKDTIINYNGGLYVTMQTALPLAHQPPDGEGMLAVYRPIEQQHTGTAEDPIPWVYGMDCYAQKYYSYEGTMYLCKADMLPCTWAPGTEGVWQWEKQE